MAFPGLVLSHELREGSMYKGEKRMLSHWGTMTRSKTRRVWGRSPPNPLMVR